MHRILALLALFAGPSASPAFAACPSLAEVAVLARAIIDRTTPPAPRDDMTLADGICARDRMWATLSQPLGDRVGWKIGLTSPAAQQRFGVPHPLAGAIYFATLRERAGETFPLGGSPEIQVGFGLVPLVESDLLVRIGDDGINNAGDDPVALLRHIAAVIPFIELPDLVFGANVPMSAPALLAINVGARYGVMGEEIAAEATPAFAARLAAMTVTLRDDRRELARAQGSVLMGHPLNALAWLLRDLKEQGRTLRAGEYVSLGGFSPALPVEAGRTYTATYEGLATQPVSVSVRVR